MTEIMVYRNPGEKMLWDLVAGGQIFPVIVAVVVFFICVIVFDKLLPALVGRIMYIRNWFKMNQFLMYVNFSLSGLVAGGICWWMWI